MKITNFLLILAVTAALSAYGAWARSEATRLHPPASHDSVPAADQIPLLTLEEAANLYTDPKVVFVDVRPESDYAVGHIEGAVLLPLEDFEKVYPTLEPRLKKASSIVVYCKSVDCMKSLWGALRLHKLGHTQTKIFPAGWNEWVIRGYPAYKAER
jgi:rhodanese-related sulfurtransferase